MTQESITEAAERVMYWLKTKGPQTAQQVAKRLEVTPMAVRQHLYVLEKQGVVTHFDEPRKVGRPARIWKLTAEAEKKFPDSHGELAAGMLQAMQAVFGAEGLEKLVEQRKRQQLQRYHAALPGVDAELGKRIEALTELRREEGYMAEWARGKDGRFQIIENHCPICTAARVCQGLCAAELELFAAALGDDVQVLREEHILSGSRRCLYTITPLRPAAG